MKSSTNPNIEVVYETPIPPLKLLDESKHYNSVELVKIINKAFKTINLLLKALKK